MENDITIADAGNTVGFVGCLELGIDIICEKGSS